MSILSRNACLIGGFASDLPDALYSDMKVGFVVDSVTSNTSMTTI